MTERGVFVVHAAGDGMLDDREFEVRRLFASLEWDRSPATGAPDPPSAGERGAPAGSVAASRDADLVRAWHRSSTSGSTGRGRWSIERGMLVVRWEAGGADLFAYNVFIHSDGLPALKIQPPGGEAIVFR